MKIAIIDVDLSKRDKHRFPNLACEKISGYWKDKGAKVDLIVDIDNINPSDLEKYDKVYASKVFTDTPTPSWLTKSTKNIKIGGTGYFFDKAPNLPNYIEHHKPDYTLYDKWIKSEVKKAEESHLKEGKEFKLSSFMVQFKEYTDYSIGYLTRGCFRKCEFCVNQKYDHVFLHSPLKEFYDPSRPKICLLDDNVLGCSSWKELLEELIATNKPFKFKQGLDERLLTDEKCKMLFNAKYDGDFTFAFDNYSDYELIHEKLKLIRKYSKSTSIKFYVLVGFEGTDHTDIEHAFERIKLLMRYKCLPYIMRYQDKDIQPWKESEYRGMYVTMARWANQPNFFKKKSFREFCIANQEVAKTDNLCASMKAMLDFEKKHKRIANKYFDLKYDNYKI